MPGIELTSRPPTISAPATIGVADSARKVAGNMLSLGAGELASRCIAFFGTAYLARTLEPAGFGALGFAAAVFSYFQLTVAAGFHDVGAREVARRPQRAASIATGVILIRFALAGAAQLALALAAWSLNKPAPVKLIMVLTGLSLFSLALDTSWVYKGLERNRLAGGALVLGQALFVSGVLIFVRGPADVARVPLAQFFGELGAALLLAVPLLRQRVGGRMELDLRAGWEVFRASWSLTLTRLLRTLIFTFDVVLLGILLGETQVGLYTAPYRICFLLLSLAAVIQVSYLPAVTRAALRGSAAVAAITGQAVYLGTAVAAPLVTGGIILAVPVIETVFGTNYVEGAPAFRLLLVSIGCAFVYGAIHNALLAVNRLKVELSIMAVSAGLNVTLNFAAIPRYGLTGAGAVTALSEVMTLLLGLLALYRLDLLPGLGPKLSTVWRPLLAAGAMGVFLIALGQRRTLILRLAAGALVYVSALVLLRGIPGEFRRLPQNSAN